MPGLDDLSELPLPFPVSSLLPFLLAWRESPKDASNSTRFDLIAKQMTAWGHPTTPQEVDGAYQALSIALNLDRAYVPSTKPLAADDKLCIVCRIPGTLQPHAHGAKLKVWSVLGASREVRVIDQRCSYCKTNHGVASVTTRVSCALLHVDQPKKPHSYFLQLLFALRGAGVPCDLVGFDVRRRPALTLLRGFDAPPLPFAVGDPPFDALVERVRQQMPTAAPAAALIHRYRANVLELPVFVPSGSWSGGQAAYDADLLCLVAGTMERTQARHCRIPAPPRPKSRGLYHPAPRACAT